MERKMWESLEVFGERERERRILWQREGKSENSEPKKEHNLDLKQWQISQFTYFSWYSAYHHLKGNHKK